MRRPSSWWLVLAAACALLAIGFAVAAIAYQRHAAQPIGEGELFVGEASAAAKSLTDAPDPAIGVKRVRNKLEVEAVSIVDGSGQITNSTSPNFVGTAVANPFLSFSSTEGRFAALATPLEASISIDGVVSWAPGDILYEVVHPMDGGGSVLIHYDISELLARRVRPAGIQSETIQLLGLTAIFAVMGIAVAVGHLRAARRYDAMAKESKLLRRHAEELAEANLSLERARRKAERALELAEEKIRIRSEFVLMINHELRTPLTSVITGAKLLQDSALGPPDRRHVLEAMVADGTRLQEMIDQILAVARIENRGLSYELEETPVDALEAALAQVDADLVHQGRSASDFEVLTDPSAVALVVSSLVDNARTHGAGTVRIGIGTSRHIEPMVEEGSEPVGALYISVTDDGPGIDPGFLPRVFEKFEKSSFMSGTGLGLYMARRIVEALDGSIAVSTSPRGTTFEIALPLAAIPQPAVRP